MLCVKDAGVSKLKFEAYMAKLIGQLASYSVSRKFLRCLTLLRPEKKRNSGSWTRSWRHTCNLALGTGKTSSIPIRQRKAFTARPSFFGSNVGGR
jgi:hypothetical protein